MIGSGGAARRRGEVVPGGEGEERGEVEAGGVEGGGEGFEGGAALGEGEGAEVAGAVLEEVVGAQVRGVAAELGRRDGLAVQALLQVGEGGDAAVVAADEELAVEGGVEVEGVEEVGEGAGRCRRRCGSRGGGRAASAAAWTRMPSHFHSAAKSAGSRRARSVSSRAWESMTGRKGVGAAVRAAGRCRSSQAKSGT